MIRSFKHKGLEDFFYTRKKKGIKPQHADRLERILDRLNAANVMEPHGQSPWYLHDIPAYAHGR